MGKVGAAKEVLTSAVDALGNPIGVLKSLVDYYRDGNVIADRIKDIPSAREIAGMTPPPPEAGGMTSAGKVARATLLRDHTSQGYLSGDKVPPVQGTIADLKGSTLMSVVGDQTGRHTVTSVGGRLLPEPVDSLAGFEYMDVPDQGYAGAKPATSSKLNEARKTENPVYISIMMGDQSGDFAMHTGQMLGRLLSNQGNMPIDKKDIPKIDELIRSIGQPVNVKDTDVNGDFIRNKDNTFKTKKITVYPFRNFTSVANDDALLKYIKSLPTGTARAYFLKGLDKSGLQKMGIPKVGDARLAVADENQIGMDWGTTGYRTMVPDLEKGAFPTTAKNSTTYDTGVDKVGPAMTILEEGRGIPANLLFRDNSLKMREKGTGGNLVFNQADYKVFESSPKKSKQFVDDQVVDIVSTFTELERRGGRRAALQYAQELLSGGKITGQMIEAARKANIPSWMIAAMAPTVGALSSIPEEDGI